MWHILLFKFNVPFLWIDFIFLFHLNNNTSFWHFSSVIILALKTLVYHFLYGFDIHSRIFSWAEIIEHFSIIIWFKLNKPVNWSRLTPLQFQIWHLTNVLPSENSFNSQQKYKTTFFLNINKCLGNLLLELHKHGWNAEVN